MNERELCLLASMPGTCPELREIAASICHRSVTRIVRALHAKGQVHISGWQRKATGGAATPIYTAGAGTDRSCTFKYRTGAEWSRLTRKRAKQSGEDEHMAARKRARRSLKLILKRPPATWFSALPGVAA